MSPFIGFLVNPTLYIGFLAFILWSILQHDTTIHILPGCQGLVFHRPIAVGFVSHRQRHHYRRYHYYWNDDDSSPGGVGVSLTSNQCSNLLARSRIDCSVVRNNPRMVRNIYMFAATSHYALKQQDEEDDRLLANCNMEVMACAGINQQELSMILDAAVLAVENLHLEHHQQQQQHHDDDDDDNNDKEEIFHTMKIPSVLEIPSWIQKGPTKDLWTEPATPDTVPGATGRVLLLSYWFDNTDVMNQLGFDHEIEVLEEMIQQAVSFQIDCLIMEKKIGQPVLVSVKPQVRESVLGSSSSYEMDETDVTMEQMVFMNKGKLYSIMKDIVQEEVEKYGLIIQCPVTSQPGTGASKVIVTHEKEMLVPDIHVEIDGAMMTNHYDCRETKECYFDISSIFVFDNFINDDLRVQLLDTIHQRNGDGNNENDDEWDDMVLGPDPKCFVKGGLCDTLDESSAASQSWGLKEELIQELCFQEHSAIVEVEQKLSKMFANDFVVSRLPEAVLGANVSPLTVNAPTYGDKFAYHIDADPNQLPPSPWTDVYGRYANRSHGKPRFVSCLLYLNAEWYDEWGAPTQFYDPPTGETFQVYPRPGRCVIMDQDISHTVVAPTKTAGARPRYSLVWKLILHPKRNGQIVKMFPNSTPVRIGSAKLSTDQ